MDVSEEGPEDEDEGEEQVSVGDIVDGDASDGMSGEERCCRETEEGARWRLALHAEERASEEVHQGDREEVQQEVPRVVSEGRLHF